MESGLRMAGFEQALGWLFFESGDISGRRSNRRFPSSNQFGNGAMSLVYGAVSFGFGAGI